MILGGRGYGYGYAGGYGAYKEEPWSLQSYQKRVQPAGTCTS